MLHSNIQKNIFLAGEKNEMEKKKGLKWEMGEKMRRCETFMRI